MKNLRLTIVLFLAIAVATINSSNAQTTLRFEDLVQLGPRDLNTYAGNYLDPGMKAFTVGLASGWINTAKPHKLLGFDITLGSNFVRVPEDQRLFNFNAADYQNLQYTGGNNAQLPTIVGGDATGQLFVEAGGIIEGPEGPVEIRNDIEFDTPDGLNPEEDLILQGIPTPAIQIGIGLVKGTDLRIRWIPAQSLLNAFDVDESFSAPSYFGIGVLHDFKQWIPGMKLLPFDLSAFVGWTKFSVDQSVEINETFGETDPNFQTSIIADGNYLFEASATTIQAIISKKISVLTPYAFVGVNFGSASTKFDGTLTYEIEDKQGSGFDEEVTYNDPIDLEFSGAGGPKLGAGVRVKLLILTLHAEYVLQRYNSINFGLGLSIR